MVLRTARKGKFAGKQFYGCSHYPDCRTIIDFDEAVAEHQIEPRMQSTPSRTTINLPPVPERQKNQAPIHVECQPNGPLSQGKLYQSVGASQEVIAELSRIHPGFDKNLLNAFAQWRLDFPLPKSTPDGEIIQVLAVAEKILRRGTITLCTPLLEQAIESQIIKPLPDDQSWLSYIKQVAEHPRIAFLAQVFDSEEEQLLYSNKLSESHLRPWLFPQVSAASLTNEGISSLSKQRVDFVLCHPHRKSYVIEVDGIQHSENKPSDQIRDNLLQANGFDVLRVNASEIRQQSGPSLDKLSQIVDSFAETPIDVHASPALESLLLIKICSQIQLVLIDAIRGGFLDFDSSSNWSIAIKDPDWIRSSKVWEVVLSAALRDLSDMLCDLYELQTSSSIEIAIDIIPPDHADLFINLNAVENQEFPRKTACFTISDIYLPFEIAQSMPSAIPLRIPQPDKNIVDKFLYRIFRKEKFLDGQWEAIQRTLQGKDSILLLPTGGGKSIAFQLAAMLLPGVCLVIDPLIALINDQISNLKSYGIDRSIGITSQLDFSEREKAQDAFGQGQYIFCYIAPERLQMKGFRSALRAITVNAPISVIAIDEAHCVSEWGHDFRVSYLNIARNARKYCVKDGIIPPLLGLTGTASRSVLRDLRRELEITDFEAVITPETFDRPELTFTIESCRSNEKKDRLLGLISTIPNRFGIASNIFYQPRGSETSSGLIFYPHVNGEYGISSGYELLNEKFGSTIGMYSGKAPKGAPSSQWDDIKAGYADKFKYDDVTILACTKAFGMGIDKPNIRFTVHMNLPSSIEAFYQEAGRAGRDRKRSECALIISNDYPERTRRLLSPSTPLDEIISTIDDIKFLENDDISRAMYFHVNAFKGIAEELRQIHKLIDELGELQEEKVVTITFSEDNRNVREKAVHRLVILGVISDYTINYANNEIELILSGMDSEANLYSYKRYIANYDQKQAEQAERLAIQKLDLKHREFIIYLSERLIRDFIYNIIELGRRRSLNEMLQACLVNPTNQGLRTRILSYLELGRFSDLLEEVRNDPRELLSLIERIKDQIGSPTEANELRGQTSRLLESYPNNPALLLTRSFAEALCRDCDNETVFENFNAFLTFAISPSGWEIDLDEICIISSQYINEVGEIRDSLAQELVVAFMEEVNADRTITRNLISHVEMSYSGYALNFLLRDIEKKVKIIVE